LGKGVLQKKLTVKANAFSASAKKAIEDAGGKAEIVAVRASEMRIRQTKNEKEI